MLKQPNIVDFIESIWTIHDYYIANSKRYHVDLDNTKKIILNMMVDEPYFIGEFQRQFGKSEMCLMYGVYIAMKGTCNKISIMYSDETTRIIMKKRLENILKNLMIVNCFRDDAFEFNTGSIIQFNKIFEDATHVIIDEASHFSEDNFGLIMNYIPKDCDIKILTSDKESNNITYNDLKKNKKFTYLRYCVEDDYPSTDI
jgi:hypothetical protein